MAESDSGQERTEDATAKRLEQAREKGQTARSKELASVSILVLGIVSLMWFGEMISVKVGESMVRLFTLERSEIFDLDKLLIIASESLVEILFPLMIILVFLYVGAFIGSIAVGGINVSIEAAMPKLSKISPIAGFKRMFGLQSWVELIKSVLKIGLIGSVAVGLILSSLEEILLLSTSLYPNNYFHALDILLNFVLFISSTLIIVVAIDIPFQLFQHAKQLKMTKQEIKDEYKEIEGKPEVKGRIRMLQREMAQRRMMSAVPQADVIITNPEHFSVALRYNPELDSAPIVVAKGTDHIALKIREIGNKYKIEIIPAPPLARALYHSTELEQQIPDGLFIAVAQVLAYIFQLKQYRKKGGNKPKLNEAAIEIPQGYQH